MSTTPAKAEDTKQHVGVTVKDVPAIEFVAAYAKFLKRSGKIEVPKWADLVKTGIHKELAPYDPDWFFVRAASIARKIYLVGGRGIGGLRKAYGGPKRRGSRPSIFVPAGGSVLRNIVQQLEKIKVLEKHPRGGRRVSHTGRRDLDRIAGRVAQAVKQQQLQQQQLNIQLNTPQTTQQPATQQQTPQQQ